MNLVYKILKGVMIFNVVAGIIAYFMGGFTPLLTIIFGALFFYYLAIYGLMHLLEKKAYSFTPKLGYFLMSIPVIFLLIDNEEFFNFFIPSIDMR